MPARRPEEVERVLGCGISAYATTDVEMFRIASANSRPSWTGMIESSSPCKMKNGGASGRNRLIGDASRYTCLCSAIGFLTTNFCKNAMNSVRPEPLAVNQS